MKNIFNINIRSKHFIFNPYGILIILVVFTVSGVNCQVENYSGRTKFSKVILEYPTDEYSYVKSDAHQTSPAYKYSTPGFFMTQVNVNEQGQNIIGDAANESSIAFDPTNPNNMAIGWRQFETISNNFRQAGFSYTNDGGQTWTFPGVIDPGIFRSDPVLDSDAEGNFYYNSLTYSGSSFWCDVYKSEDGGASWDFGTFAQGGDKQWMSIDKTNGVGAGNIYAYWSSASICSPDFFTRSVDGGFNYEDCSYIPGEPYWGTTAVNVNGDLFVCGAQDENFMVAKSSNVQNPGQTVTWDFSTTVNLDGSIVAFGGGSCPNPAGLLGQTIIAIDSSGGSSNGNVYVLCSVERHSNSDPCDVMFARSTDGGLTWSSPIRVNDDPGENAWQWFGTMSVAPNGRIDVIWLDTRDNPGSLYSTLYYACSVDGGDTWSENIPLTDSFDPHIGWPQQFKMGDYFDMYSDETGAHLAWAATFNAEQDVYYGHINPTFAVIDKNIKNPLFSLFQNFPNPCKDYTTIPYQLSENGFVSIRVYDMTGREVASLVNKEQNQGYYQQKFNASRLEEGLYFYSLKVGDVHEFRKLIVLK